MIFEIPLSIRRDSDAMDYLKSNINANDTFVLHGSSISRAFTVELDLDKLPGCAVQGKSNDIQQLACNESFLRCANLVAIGGGSVIDVAKRCALLYDKDLIVIPTVIANDGLISPISVLDIEGIKTSLPGKMPSELLLIFNIISRAPERFVNASLLDSLSNTSASYDWRYFSNTFKTTDEVAATLAEVTAKYLTGASLAKKADKVKLAIDQQVLAGISMLLAGSSQPCSGSEHILCRIADSYSEFEHYLHGELVGAFSLYSKYLQKTIAQQDLDFVNSIFPEWSDIFLIITDKIGPEEFFSGCHMVRPDRKTVLDLYTEIKLVNALRRFMNYAN